MRTGIALSLLVICAPLGCSRRAAPHYVEHLEVLVPPLAEADTLGIRSDRVEAMLSQELKANGHFEFPKQDKAGAKRGHPTKLELELAPVQEGPIDGKVGNYLELEASLLVKRRGEDGWSSYEVGERVQEKISGASLEERQAAAARAIKSALHETVLMADLQLDAVEKSDRELIRELNATNPLLRDAAIRVLADRKNPAVRGALIDKLKGSDVDGVRRAIGGLVALRDTQAVPALIELARGKDPSFLREILFALGAIGGEEAQAYLFTVSQGHDDSEIRQVAEQALSELQSRMAAGEQRREGGKQHVQRSTK